MKIAVASQIMVSWAITRILALTFNELARLWHVLSRRVRRSNFTVQRITLAGILQFEVGWAGVKGVTPVRKLLQKMELEKTVEWWWETDVLVVKLLRFNDIRCGVWEKEKVKVTPKFCPELKPMPSNILRQTYGNYKLASYLKMHKNTTRRPWYTPEVVIF